MGPWIPYRNHNRIPPIVTFTNINREAWFNGDYDTGNLRLTPRLRLHIIIDLFFIKLLDPSSLFIYLY